MEETLSQRDRTIAIAVLLLGGVAIGAAPIFVRLAQDTGVGPSAIAFWRLVFAVGPLALWAALEPRTPKIADPSTERPAAERGARIWMLAGLGGFFFAADLVTWHAGIVRTTAANATLLANLTPVIVALFAWLIFKERPTPLFLAALAATLVGAALLSGGNLAGAETDAPQRALGDLLSALTAFWYAFYMLAVKAVRAAWSTPRVMAVMSAISIPFTLAAALAFSEPLVPEDPVGWLWLIGLGLVCQVVGQTGIAYGLGRLSAALSSLVILIQPVVAAAIAWVLFGEALGPIELAGGALVIAGIIAAQREKRPATASRLAETDRTG